MAPSSCGRMGTWHGAAEVRRRRRNSVCSSSAPLCRQSCACDVHVVDLCCLAVGTVGLLDMQH